MAETQITLVPATEAHAPRMARVSIHRPDGPARARSYAALVVARLCAVLDEDGPVVATIYTETPQAGKVYRHVGMVDSVSNDRRLIEFQDDAWIMVAETVSVFI